MSQLLMQDWNQQVCHASILSRYRHWLSLDLEPEPTSTPPSVDQVIGPSVGPTIGEFTTQYHPHSRQSPETQPFMDFNHKQQSSSPPLSKLSRGAHVLTHVRTLSSPRSSWRLVWARTTVIVYSSSSKSASVATELSHTTIIQTLRLHGIVRQFSWLL